MAVEAKIVTIATGTGTSQIDTAHGMSQTPQVAILAHAGSVAGGQDGALAIGAFTSSTERASFSCFIEGDPTTTDSASLIATDSCFQLLNTVAAVDGALDGVGFDATNVSVIPDNGFVQSNAVSCLLLAGLDNVKVGTFTLGASTGSQSFTPLSFAPDVMIFFGVSGVAAGTIAAHARFSYGWSTVTANRAFAVNSRDGQTDTQTDGIISDDYAWVALAATTGAVSDGFTVTSFNADGWTLNKSVGANTPLIGYIALKGCSAAIIDSAFRSDTSNITVTGASFTPKAVLSMFRTTATASEEDTSTTHMDGGFGWGTSSSNRYAAWLGEEDAQPTNDPKPAQSTSLLALTFDLPVGSTSQGSVDVVSLDSGGATLDQVVAGVNLTYLPLLFLGDAATAAADPASTEDILRVEV